MSDRIAAVRNWPTPTTVKEVQRFLGFANYYRRFIRGFGQVVAPTTSLLKGGPVRLQWTAEADRAFSYLRALFTSVPVLAHPDPSLAFIVEVRGWDRSCALSALGYATEVPPLCFLHEEAQPGRAKLTWETGSCWLSSRP
jgi:hypothetical protein